MIARMEVQMHEYAAALAKRVRESRLGSASGRRDDLTGRHLSRKAWFQANFAMSYTSKNKHLCKKDTAAL